MAALPDVRVESRICVNVDLLAVLEKVEKHSVEWSHYVSEVNSGFAFVHGNFVDLRMLFDLKQAINFYLLVLASVIRMGVFCKYHSSSLHFKQSKRFSNRAGANFEFCGYKAALWMDINDFAGQRLFRVVVAVSTVGIVKGLGDKLKLIPDMYLFHQSSPVYPSKKHSETPKYLAALFNKTISGVLSQFS